MAVLPSTPLKVGLLTLPSATVPIHLTDATRAYLDAALDAIPADKRGSARLVLDWTQVGGAAVDAEVGMHVKGPLDAAAGAGWSQQRGAYVGAMLRIEWD